MVICPPGGAVSAVSILLLLPCTRVLLPWTFRHHRSWSPALPHPAVAVHVGPAGGAVPRLSLEAAGAGQGVWRGAAPSGLRLLPLSDADLCDDGGRREEVVTGPDNERAEEEERVRLPEHKLRDLFCTWDQCPIPRPGRARA